jgi:predicted nucleotidyltransferase
MNPLVQTKTDITRLLCDNSAAIRDFGVKRLGLFGSFISERQTNESDVDILVEFHKDKKTFDNFINLSFFLETILKRDIELVTPEALNPHLSGRILNEVEYVPFPV